MTIDQRLEFLVQSTESLHATAMLHSEQLDKLTGQMSKVIQAMALIEHKFAELASTMGEIAVAALNHERRLGKLDGAPDQT